MRIAVMLIIIISLFIGSGCSGGLKVKQVRNNDNGYTLTDARGKEIYFEQKPQRIVSLFCYSDEILLELVDHKRILALSKWVHNPDISNSVEQAKDITLIAEPNPEFLLKHNADLVILSEGTQLDLIKLIEDLGIKVYVYKMPNSISEIKTFIRELAAVTGEKEKGEQIVGSMDEKLKKVISKISQKYIDKSKTALLYGYSGIKGGKGTIADDLLRHAQVINACNAIGIEGNMPTSKEHVIQADPDVLLVYHWSFGRDKNTGSQIIGEILQDKSLASLKALKTNSIYLIPIRYTYCVSQHAVDGVEAIADLVYGTNK